MKIYNTKNIAAFGSTLNSIACNLGVKLSWNQVSNNCYRVKLNLGPEKKYQRLGFMRKKDNSRSKVNAVCWHGYRDFLKELYEIPGNNFRVVTAQATYNNKQDFYNKFESTGNNNIGSVMDPLPYRKACNCEDIRSVTVTHKELAANNYNLDPKYWINKKNEELIK
tara:strand:- start:561 stop:1058 length:498 start_codon:yes stop_codon:yes gene_type:complete